MEKLLSILLVLFLPFISVSQEARLRAIGATMSSTFSIKGEKLAGTCFMVLKNNQQYFVTAAHLFKPSHKSGDLISISMLVQNEWKSLQGKLYFHKSRQVDIVILRLQEKVVQHINLPEELLKYHKLPPGLIHHDGIPLDSTSLAFGTEDLNFGTEAFFYGFPLDNLGTVTMGIKFPLLKKAIVSGLLYHNGVEVIVLDGHVNRGFSGGPVVAYDVSRKRMSLIGVNCGYFAETTDVEFKGDQFSLKNNSGIIVCHLRRYIDEIFNEIK
jgi:hypothetical protein